MSQWGSLLFVEFLFLFFSKNLLCHNVNLVVVFVYFLQGNSSR